MLDTEPGRHDVPPARPLLVGDVVAGRRVAGFAWIRARRRGKDAVRTHLGDRLLLDGDERLLEPPDRLVPQTAEGAELMGVMPPGDLPGDRVHAASDINTAIPSRVNELLNLPGAAWRPLIQPLLAAVHAAGHRLWLSGGAVRDILVGAPLRDVKDLDLAGTLPPGWFTDIARQVLRVTQMSEYFRTTITPNSLVCAVEHRLSRKRIVEYRGLSRGGFYFPSVGSHITEDARYRDFSFNALLYDAVDHRVFDGCGQGLDDLLGKQRDDLLGQRRQFVPQDVRMDPVTRAKIILRATKFALRWDERTALRLAPLHSWIRGLPADFCRTLTGLNWAALISEYRRTVHAPEARQRAFAATLPEPGREFIETLIGTVR